MMSDEPTGSPPPVSTLASACLAKLIPDLAIRAENFRTDIDVADEELMALFAEEIRRVADGLSHAVPERDEERIRNHAHTLQGMGGAAGAPEISVLGEEFSSAARSGKYSRCEELLDAFLAWRQAWTAPAGEVSRETSSDSPMPALEGTILVVDDELPNRRYLEKLLSDCGSPVVLLAESGEQALEVIRSRQPDVALVDVMMPGLNGYEVCGIISKDPDLSGTLVIMVTARSTVEDIEHAFVQGAFDYIRKPFHSRELLARVRNALQLKRQNDALKKWKQRMQRELELAGTLQAELFDTHPLLGRDYDLRVAYQPSLGVGGDMFDLIRLPGGKLFAYVADVAGHGVASALISTLLKGLVHEIVLAQTDQPLYSMANRIHQRYRTYVKDPEIYATMQIIRADTRTRRIEAFCCGHPPMLVIDAQGNDCSDLVPGLGGMPIGLMPGTGAVYEQEDEVAFDLPDGGTLFLYSDGLVETQLAGGEECGRDGLMAAIQRAWNGGELGVGRAPVDVLRDLAGLGYNLPADDCSLISLHLLGSGELLAAGDHAATLDDAESVATVIHDRLVDNGWDLDSAMMARLLAIEHLANVADHARVVEGGVCTYRLAVAPGGCHLLFRDPGREWDAKPYMKRAADPAPEAMFATRGRGLGMIRRVAGVIEIFRRDNYNHTFYTIERDVVARLNAETGDDDINDGGTHDG